ncbi:MAG TPA: DUF4175 family protein [Pyrinomonadaceae bacterium]|nr:DUF4175 family protein [Pyrinomonadaceae bacterium]
MNTEYTDQSLLKELLRKARARRQLLLSLRGAAISLGVVAAVLLLTGWAAHRYRYNGSALLVLRIGAVLMVLATIYFALLRPLLKRITDARLARLIEERSPGTEDRLVTAVECANDDASRISPALVGRLYRDADSVSASVDVRNVIRQSRLLMYGGAALASLLLFAGVLKWGPREISEGVAQLVTPTTMAASSSAMSIKVKPGTARVPKGSDQDILATLVNFDSQNVTVYARPLGSKEDFQGQVMEPAKARSDFRFSIFNIQDSIEYFVESNTIRSEVYKLNVVDLPYVKQLDLSLNFPAFTNLPTKTVEDGGDIAALKGTVATVTAKLSGKVRAARIVFADGKKTDMRVQGNDFVGELTVAADTSYYIELVSNDGEAYRGSNEYDVSVLADQPPVISFDKPGRDRKATNLEEVFTQARAEDDYGVVAMDLHFSVNGGEEKKVNLQQLTRESARSLSGAYTFFLEEFKLKPGDFISYYAKARDASNESTSDIYFIEVKPFEMEYKQSQQQGGGGGGGEGGEQDQNALSRRQKDLIAATHRLIREGEKYTDQERKDGYEAVALGQEKLRTDTLEFLDRMGRRLGDVEGQKQVVEMAEHLKQAAKEMEGAPPPLRKEAGKDALPPEQRALQRLLAADAIFREVQVAFGNQNSSGGGGGGQREQQELAGLFELELDKMKNQYETVQRAQQQRAEQQKSEAERRLEELARRQQQALEEQRRRMQQAANGGGGGNQRQQQEMIEETRKAARELERLSRERRDPQMQELSRQLNQTADEMQKAQASSRNNSGESVAQNERALENLRRAQERLQQMNGATGQRGGQSGPGGRQQQISDLRQRAAQAASRQREIAKDMESLTRRGGQNAQDENSRKAREQLAERKDTLADSVNNLQQDIEQSARAMGAGQGQGQQRAARQLKDAADALARDRVAERIREGKQALNGQQGGQQGGQQQGQQSGQQGGRTDERAIERSLNSLSERLQAAEQSARGANGSSAEENLDRTRQLADNLDSLRRRLDENSRRGNGQQQQQSNQQGQQPGQQQGQQGQRGQQGQSGREGQQGQQGQEGQQGRGQQGSEGSQQGSQQAGGTQNGGQSDANRQRGGIDRGGVMGGDWGDNRQLPAEIRERLREAQDLRREWGTTGLGAGRLDEVIEELKRLADGKMDGDAATASYLKSEVVEPLRQLELELSRALQQQSGRTNLRLRDEGAAPEKYRKAVEEYYRRLSGARQRQ